MFDLFAKFRKTKIWDFGGGIHPPEMKDQTRRIPIKRLPLPSLLLIPLQQHLGPEGDLLVQKGDYVLKGQALTTGKNRTLPVHASTSGTITEIGYYPSTHPSAIPERCIRLEPDGQDKWFERYPLPDYLSYTPEQLIAHIHRAGVAGLGGAVFPTASKIQGALTRVNTLIINGAECEPYITADDRLMQEYADELITGCEILRHILKPTEILIGIEDNKPEAIENLNHALQRNKSSDIFVRVIPTKYPSGGAKQLTKILTGREVPHGGRSSDIGVLMQNVGTVFAIKRAVVDGEPLIERIVTITGDAITHKGNVWGLLGTPVAELLCQTGYQLQSKRRVIMGGPLMGFALSDLSVPMTKLTNCIIAPSIEEIAPPEPEQACIRCTQCAEACPAGLLPQQLYWFSRGKEHEKARNYNLFDCIECGACAYVCPSNIPLVQYYRQEKAEIREQDKQSELARLAKIRFEAKQARLEKEKQARLQRHKRAETKLTSDDNQTIQSALERVRKQKSTDESENTTQPIIKSINGTVLPDNSAAIAARQARKAQRQKRLTELNVLETSPSAAESVEQDPRKAALAAAIARAKAKKEQQKLAVQTETKPTLPETMQTTSSSDSEKDERKAAVAAAIARAKARKERTNQESEKKKNLLESHSDNNNSTDNERQVDDRKAAVAEAIARAKARKAQKEALQLTTSGEE